jgi:molybdopterin-guanine dinucleotide biosynthesis protein A
VLIAACDHPFVADAVDPLLAARTGGGPEVGALAVDAGGRRQHLLCVVSTSALRDAVAAQRSLTDLAAHRLLAPLELIEVPLPPRATHDVDSWHDREVAEGHTDG